MKKKILRITPIEILRRGHYSYHLFYWMYGMYYDLRLSGRSLNGTFATEHDGANPAQSIAYVYLKELVKILDYKPDDVFVDVGCAWGRLIGYLMRKTNIRKFVGIELNKDIANVAIRSFERYNNVDIIEGNVLEMLPTEGSIFYLFNPFDGNVLRAFLDQIGDNVKKQVRLIYLHPIHHEEIDSRIEWTLKQQYILKPKYMGELELNEYVYNSHQ